MAQRLTELARQNDSETLRAYLDGADVTALSVDAALREAVQNDHGDIIQPLLDALERTDVTRGQKKGIVRRAFDRAVKRDRPDKPDAFEALVQNNPRAGLGNAPVVNYMVKQGELDRAEKLIRSLRTWTSIPQTTLANLERLFKNEHQPDLLRALLDALKAKGSSDEINVSRRKFIRRMAKNGYGEVLDEYDVENWNKDGLLSAALHDDLHPPFIESLLDSGEVISDSEDIAFLGQEAPELFRTVVDSRWPFDSFRGFQTLDAIFQKTPEDRLRDVFIESKDHEELTGQKERTLVKAMLHSYPDPATALDKLESWIEKQGTIGGELVRELYTDRFDEEELRFGLKNWSGDDAEKAAPFASFAPSKLQVVLEECPEAVQPQHLQCALAGDEALQDVLEETLTSDSARAAAPVVIFRAAQVGLNLTPLMEVIDEPESMRGLDLDETLDSDMNLREVALAGAVKADEAEALHTDFADAEANNQNILVEKLLPQADFGHLPDELLRAAARRDERTARHLYRIAQETDQLGALNEAVKTTAVDEALSGNDADYETARELIELGAPNPDSDRLKRALKDEKNDFARAMLDSVDSVNAGAFYAAILNSPEDLYEKVARRYNPRQSVVVRAANKIMGTEGVEPTHINRVLYMEEAHDFAIDWDTEPSTHSSNEAGQTPLRMALGFAGSSNVKHMPNRRSETGFPTALFIEWLIRQGATVDSDVLDFARRCDQTAKFPLLARGDMTEEARIDVLNWACERANVDAYEALIEEQGLDPNYKDGKILRKYAEHFPYGESDSMLGKRLPRLFELGVNPASAAGKEAVRELIETLIEIDPPPNSSRLKPLKQLVETRERMGAKPPPEKLIRRASNTAIPSALSNALNRRSAQYVEAVN